MANSLHFVKNKVAFLKMLKSRLTSNGVLVIVEYEMIASNPWVPFPIGFRSLVKAGMDAGYTSVRQMANALSKYQKNGIYSALMM
jgi:hypothetical protein